MSEELNLVPISEWFEDKIERPFVIAGPCSAETEEQVYKSAEQISKIGGVSVFRAGIWKPRTRPGNFEGVGTEALSWLQNIKKEFGLKTTVEVATAKHAEAALKHGIDILWLGARTVSNPFSVQEIADFLKGTDIPILIKNPLNPDLSLWRGAIERIHKTGIHRIAAIHRGFHPFEHTKFRNIPKWEIPIELKSQFHNLPIIIDPSHISGKKEYIFEITQKAMDLNMDGIMVEVHNDPQKALSDKEQQITPDELAIMLSELNVRKNNIDDQFLFQLTNYRNQIDSIDSQVIELLKQRMDVVENIGNLKCENDVTILQLSRWETILKTRLEWGQDIGLSESFLKEILKLIHKEAIQKQVDAMKCKENKKSKFD